ncbi:D-alanyl-D-alanine carboxypeptidase family protein [Litoribrevibacter albus]|uniref:serine-type D-Ala-D-Ala carboxypeptidase n=1 Tax=Litoribrevibacter albus TaxID=1473156 RepID=A0AA37SDC9_9GAMM|nr:D-alanyl-D-alanine carboxypeptidase family protein [Litoribrevibacter albus]GLQ32451.1 D-Ala-D-Ala carboxypeptidase [Litoribrevibacter albus]
MKAKPFNILISFLLFCLSSLSLAATLIPASPQLAASAYILLDANSGKVLVENNPDERVPPASLTKMMTSYIAVEEIQRGNISLDDEVLVSEKAWRMPGSRMFIEVGKKVKVEDLLRGIIIQSGNDASVAMAEHVAGSEAGFADLMNQYVSELGMSNTHFMNATGLPHEEHYASARDLAILAEHTIVDHPDFYGIYSEKVFKYNGIEQPNRNRLLWRDSTVDGLKTGHTNEAGYCLVASAEKDGMRLISVVLGTRSEEARARETQKLLNYGFRYFETLSLYEAGAELTRNRIWKGVQDQVSLGIIDDIVITVPRGSRKEVKANLEVDTIIEAPIQQGQELGLLKIDLNGETLVEKPLVALKPVEEAGFFARLWDAIKLFFIGLFGD